MHTYSVKRLNSEIDELLAARYTSIQVEGEVGELKTPSSGHCYLTLRDSDSSLACVVWRSSWGSIRYRPTVGERVVCRGRLRVYQTRGVYQLYVNDIQPAGMGALAKEIKARIERLKAEGLLDPRRKRALPRFPRAVGVATSLTGAALQDFLKVSAQRHPATRILVAGCTVQGVEAPASIIRAVEMLLEDGESEVIVVTRGGGASEDLAAFQDEHLARFLAHCPVPVVSAVGHQVDTTIADMVADQVAPTPSAAAMLVLPDGPMLSQQVDEMTMALEETMRRLLQSRRLALGALEARLRHPGERLKDIRGRTKELEARLAAVMQRTVVDNRRFVAGLEPRAAVAIHYGVRDRLQHLEGVESRLLPAWALVFAAKRNRLQTLYGQLMSLSPEDVLRRGYAIVKGPAGIVVDAAQVSSGDEVSVRVSEGEFDARVS